jgi:hypothetical protein
MKSKNKFLIIVLSLFIYASTTEKAKAQVVVVIVDNIQATVPPAVAGVIISHIAPPVQDGISFGLDKVEIIIEYYGIDILENDLFTGAISVFDNDENYIFNIEPGSPSIATFYTLNNNREITIETSIPNLGIKRITSYAYFEAFPVAICDNLIVPVDENCNAHVLPVEVNNGSYDIDGNIISYELIPEGPYTLGENEVTLLVTDDSGRTDACEAVITVIDEIAPVINLVTDSITLWPPNHSYENIDISQLIDSVSDNCANVSIDDVYISSVSSDELEDGSGDGNTLDDIIISEDCKSVLLRRERKGNSDGRVYRINFNVDDGSGNSSSQIGKVYVPQNKNVAVIDSGIAYEETCSNDNSLNVNEFDNASFDIKLWPNPSTKYFNIKFNKRESLNNSKMEVYDINGRLVYRNLNINGDSLQFGESLGQGIYIVKLSLGEKSKVFKLIKQ